jgi:ABC-type transport system involved in multi-copper enzyme maturation permease subunit
MAGLLAVVRREFAAYFATPVATVFIVIFLALSGTLTFTLGQFFPRGSADLTPFFQFVPWLFLFLVPAITMRLWAEEGDSARSSCCSRCPSRNGRRWSASSWPPGRSVPWRLP